MALPFPEQLTAEAAHYFAAAAQGRLELQRCAACAKVWFFPRPACVACGSSDYAWIRASGRGTVQSFSIVRRAPSPEFRDRLPYVVALIDLEDGPRMMTNIVITSYSIHYTKLYEPASRTASSYSSRSFFRSRCLRSG